MARDYAQTAKELVAALGGNENINNVTHCATRLRFILSDHKVVNKEKASKVQGVITTVEAGGQFQVVIWNHVKDAYEQVLKLVTPRCLVCMLVLVITLITKIHGKHLCKEDMA